MVTRSHKKIQMNSMFVDVLKSLYEVRLTSKPRREAEDIQGGSHGFTY